MRVFLISVLRVCWAALALAMLAGTASATTGTMTLTASKTSVTEGGSVDFTLSVTDGDPMPDQPTYIMYVNDNTDLYGDFTSNPMTVSRAFDKAGTYHVMVWVNTAASKYWYSNVVDITVQKPVFDTTTSLTATPAVVMPGSNVTLKASVTASDRTVSGGTVTFKDGAVTMGTANVAAGKAQLIKNNLAVGSRSITAVYNGLSNGTGDNFNPSTSSSVTVKVGASGSISLLTSSDHLKPGDPIKLTATALDGSGKPITTLRGQVATFKMGTTTLGTATLGNNGAAKLTTTGLAFGTQSITATLSALSSPVSKPRTVQVDYFGDPQTLISGASTDYSAGKAAVASLFGGGNVIVSQDPMNHGAIDFFKSRKRTNIIILGSAFEVGGIWVGPGVYDGKGASEYQGFIRFINKDDRSTLNMTFIYTEGAGLKMTGVNNPPDEHMSAPVALQISNSSIKFVSTDNKGNFDYDTCNSKCSSTQVKNSIVLNADIASKRLPGGKLAVIFPTTVSAKCTLSYTLDNITFKTRQANTGACNFAVPPFIVAMGGNKFGIAWANGAGANKPVALQLATFDENGSFVKQFGGFATLPTNLKGVDLQLIDQQHYALTWSSVVKNKQVVSMALYDTKGEQVGTTLQLADSAYYPKFTPSYGANQAPTKQGYLVSEVYKSSDKTWNLVSYPWQLP
ncbi:Ig-like domain-containing protein [Oryzibacter oryziterrae]|uniref:Ig-like domain-containing protein n=1 Tax=Oryzibacter oryziterrae TaxID=2766474 RepID=UPI001F1B2013|nr:Ig-like domain-containing protein [Oryzibacter oryziterrae]